VTLEQIANFMYEWFTVRVLFTIQDVDVKLSTILVAVLCFVASAILSKWLRSLLKARLLGRLSIDPGLEFAFLRFIHYGILACGIYIGLASLGIPLGALAGFVTLLGVGIGFGLQNLAANFISGIILLVERPVKIGDRITVEDVWGEVVQINLRTTVVSTLDNISMIIPNSKLLENKLINWSYGEKRVRLRIPVGIAYGSDVDLATQLMIQAAAENPRVLKDPAPAAFFLEFGNSSLNFELYAWIPDSMLKPEVGDQLHRSIDRLFRENNVEIPFPQRDLHLRSSDVPLATG
jgi:small-conductance mechanosensitive channel